MAIESIGWIASFLFSICAIPQAWQCYRAKSATGISKTFMAAWLLGELLMQLYVFMKHGWDLPLLLNYWFNTAACIVIVYYQYREFFHKHVLKTGEQ